MSDESHEPHFELQMPHPVIDSLNRLVAKEQAYPIEAYLFVYQALEVAQTELLGERRHVSGQQLLEGVRRHAIDHFGPLALMVFRHWGITRTGDFGEMVFHLVEHNLMGKTEDDRLEDFQDVYDLEETFADERVLAELRPTEVAPFPRLERQHLGSRAEA